MMHIKKVNDIQFFCHVQFRVGNFLRKHFYDAQIPIFKRKPMNERICEKHIHAFLLCNSTKNINFSSSASPLSVKFFICWYIAARDIQWMWMHCVIEPIGHWTNAMLRSRCSLFSLSLETFYRTTTATALLLFIDLIRLLFIELLFALHYADRWQQLIFNFLPISVSRWIHWKCDARICDIGFWVLACLNHSLHVPSGVSSCSWVAVEKRKICCIFATSLLSMCWLTLYRMWSHVCDSMMQQNMWLFLRIIKMHAISLMPQSTTIDVKAQKHVWRRRKN